MCMRKLSVVLILLFLAIPAWTDNLESILQTLEQGYMKLSEGIGELWAGLDEVETGLNGAEAALLQQKKDLSLLVTELDALESTVKSWQKQVRLQNILMVSGAIGLLLVIIFGG